MKIFLAALKCDQLPRPTLNTRNLKPPHENVQEMNTVCMAYKAYSISESKSLNLNSDGKTKFHNKLAAVSLS